ncbi:MAG: NAD(P)-dependent dehydrogenase (short-subunit alcohol dehydrogenase family) [Bermanella sp.]|jgi:NAD(P)-dependent dehydrogenase (short-subunit alcohol dehydrogenase family)|uniref:SDR family oxidoreductase n=1 Tax=Glaciecola sp. 33A TaxID=2057807 RepID=UPI000C33C641|nr:SDR family oxidoreductase [Glaciecola sp. 33A]PKI03485.1 NAD(P)-dependent oxidoreductase [Glaciecola sp. 33A]
MNSIVLVTGGSRGIGAATAVHLAKLGYAVCVNYLSNETEANNVVAKIEGSGGKAIAVQADVANENDVIRLFKVIDSSLGRITHLVNNAGILLPQMRVCEMSAERINKVLTTNVTSYFLCCREAIKRMHNGGSIVNVSSAAARLGAPSEYVDYAASKGAIDTLTRGLSLEVAADNIRVNCVRPGFIHTNMHSDGGEPDRIERLKKLIPLQRGGEPEEVAASIAFLLSNEASYITGTFVDLAGGK